MEMGFPHHVCYMDDPGLGLAPMVGDYLLPDGTVNPAWSDNAPAWNAIMAAAGPGDTLILPPRYSGFGSAIERLPPYVRLKGAGGNSALVKTFNGGLQTTFLRLGSWTVTEDITLITATGLQDGIAWGGVGANAQDTLQHVTVRNVLTAGFGTGQWYGGGIIDGLNGVPAFGSRDHNLHDCMLQACSNFGLRLAGVNGVNGTGISCALPATAWGIWTIGTSIQPSNLINLSGWLGASILMYGTNASLFTGSAVGSVVMDNQCNSNAVYAAFVSAPPALGGHNNHVYGNGTAWHGAP